MTAEEKFAQVSQPIDAPFLSLSERQAIADDQHSPRADVSENQHIAQVS